MCTASPNIFIVATTKTESVSVKNTQITNDEISLSAVCSQSLQNCQNNQEEEDVTDTNAILTVVHIIICSLYAN